MKLLHYTYRKLSLLLLLLMAAWGVLFYYAIIDEVMDETDDTLENYSEILINNALMDPSVLETEGTLMSFYKFRPISEEEAEDYDEKYYDSTVYIESEDEDEDSSGAAYPDEVISVLRGLKDGEVADDIIETDTGYYVVRLDKINDEDATASKRESLQNSKESTYYTETTNQWLDDADVKVVKKVLKTLKITDKHTFTAPTSTPTPSPEVTEEATPTPEADVTEEAEATETPAAEDTEATVTPTEEAEATETPEATPTEAAE